MIKLKTLIEEINKGILTNNPTKLYFVKQGEHSHSSILFDLFEDELYDLINKDGGDEEDVENIDNAIEELSSIKNIIRIVIDKKNLYFGTFGKNEPTQQQMRLLKNYCIENGLRLVRSIGIKNQDIDLNEKYN